MKLLNLDSGDEAATPNKKKSKWLKIGIGVSALVLIPTIGSTLAGTITIGSGSVEFGQGVVDTAACDGEITVAPTSDLTEELPSPSLNNGSLPSATIPVPYFSLGTISVSDIDGGSCDPVTFIIRAYNDNGGETPLCSNVEPELYVFFDSTGEYISSSCGGINYSDSDPDTDGNGDGFAGSGDGYFEWVPDLTDLYLHTGYVSTITIESSSLPCDDANYAPCD